MSPAHFAAVVQAETSKLFSRSSARFGVVFAVILGLGVPLFFGGILWLVRQADPAAGANVDPAEVVYTTLWIRNFFLMRIVLIMMGALSLAGEFQARTLREDVLRPVPRSAILFAKWLALVAWIAATLALSLAPAASLSLVAWGTTGDWQDVLLAWLATLACDAAFGALVLMTAAILRSVAGTMVGMFLFYFFDVAAWAGLNVVHNLGAFTGLPEWAPELAGQALPYLPSAAYGAWMGGSPFQGTWTVEAFVALLSYGLVAYIVADRVFARIDVP